MQAQRGSYHGTPRNPNLLRVAPQPAWQLPSATEMCLVLIHNKTQDGLTVKAEARTPKGPCFLDSTTVDLDAGGAMTFLACAGNEVHVDCGNGLHKLALQPNGELRLLPGMGLRQKMTTAGAGIPAKYLLYVDIEDVVSSHDHQLPSLEDVMRTNPACAGMRAAAAAVDGMPLQCTVLAPRSLPRELADLSPDKLICHLTLPVAIFCSERRGGTEKTLDGADVQIQVLSSGAVVFAIDASSDAPAVRLHSEAVPMRCAERFQLLYSCE